MWCFRPHQARRKCPSSIATATTNNGQKLTDNLLSADFAILFPVVRRCHNHCMSNNITQKLIEVDLFPTEPKKNNYKKRNLF